MAKRTSAKTKQTQSAEVSSEQVAGEKRVVAAIAEDDPRGVPRRLAALMDRVNDKYGGQDEVTKDQIAVIKQASRAAALDVTRVPTGIWAIDVAIGGGLPKGRITSLCGPESSAKTTTALHAIASAQQYCRFCNSLLYAGEVWDPRHVKAPDWLRQEDLHDVLKDAQVKPADRQKYQDWMTLVAANELLTSDPELKGADLKARQTEIAKFRERWLKVNVEWKLSSRLVCSCLRGAMNETVWLDTEGAFDRKWAECQGVDTGHVYVIQPETAEEGIDVADAMLRSGEVDFLVVDSIAQLTPAKEIEDSAEQWTIGLLARLVNKALRKWTSSLNIGGVDSQVAPIIILVNQQRVSPGQYGPKMVRPGGKGQDFAESIRIDMHKSKLEGDDESGATRGRYSFHIAKNKTYAPNARGEYILYLSGAEAGKTHEAKDVVKAALEHEVIARLSQTTYVYVTAKGEEYRWGSQKQILNDMAEDYFLAQEIRHRTLHTILGLPIRDIIPNV